jgi:hypothetical protein
MAEVRLDPAIAFWAAGTWQSEPQATVNGDVYCEENLNGDANINGDAFADGNITAADIEGQKNENVEQPPIAWPGLDINDFSSVYYVESTGYPVQNIAPGTYSNYPFGSALNEPPKVFYCAGDIELAGGVTINGMLVVDQNMTVSDANNGWNVITAGKNFPALLVGGEITVQTAGKLKVNGLAQIGNRIKIDDGAENVDIDIVGGLFIANGNIDGLAGSSASNSVVITASPVIASIKTWPTPPGDAVRWTPAGGAFFRSIERE